MFGLLVGVVVGATAAEHRWTVRDSIELSVFLHPGNQYLQSSQVEFSLDGKRIIAATMRGDLSSGKRVATIYWLNRHRDPDPTKAARYKLWDRMKANLPIVPKDNIAALDLIQRGGMA